MPVINLHFHPAKMGISTSVSLALPVRPEEGDRKLPALYLLHGGGGCCLDFLYTGITRFAEQYRVAVIMPDGQNSSWVDMTYGPKWETYLTESLPDYVTSHFPVSGLRKDTCIAGVSMGGYGAIHTGLRHPEKYAAVCGMGSGVALPEKYALGTTRSDALKTLDAALEASFGSDRNAVPGSGYDCLQAAREATEGKAELPRILMCCGTEDFSYAENVRYRDAFRGMGIPVEWMETEAGHEQKAWDTFMPEMFRWMYQEYSRND